MCNMRVIISLAIPLTLILAACDVESLGTATPEGESGSTSPTATITRVRCENVQQFLIRYINDGLTVDGGGSIRAAKAVRSTDYESVWIVAADLQGPGLDGSNQIGVWATNNISDPSAGGLLYSVNGIASEFSEWGKGPGIPLNADGVQDSIDCTKQALQ